MFLHSMQSGNPRATPSQLASDVMRFQIAHLEVVPAVNAMQGSLEEIQPPAASVILAQRALVLDAALAPLTPLDRLKSFRREIEGPVVFTHGFGIEGQLIFHLICEADIDVDVVSFDTGRLFPETYDLWRETERRYGRRIRAIRPDAAGVQAFVATYGVDGFYASQDARLACCKVRKTDLLAGALAGAAGWIAGLRSDQTAVRKRAGMVSYESRRKVIKFNPLFDWTRDGVTQMIRAAGVPVNALHARGYASIGCAPCTRAIRPGESERAGRWWWERDRTTECGLHMPPRG
jgi:phosphoadenosine phosphosulfate reductase